MGLLWGLASGPKSALYSCDRKHLATDDPQLSCKKCDLPMLNSYQLLSSTCIYETHLRCVAFHSERRYHIDMTDTILIANSCLRSLIFNSTSRVPCGNPSVNLWYHHGPCHRFLRLGRECLIVRHAAWGWRSGRRRCTGFLEDFAVLVQWWCHALHVFLWNYIKHYLQKTDISYLTCTFKKWQICIKNWQICPCFGSRNCQADLPGFRLTGMEVPCRCHECRCRSDLVHQGSLAPGSVNPGVFHLLNITLVPRNAAELRTVESRWKLQKVAETHDVLWARIVRDLILYVCRCGSQEMYRIMSCWCPVQRSTL